MDKNNYYNDLGNKKLDFEWLTDGASFPVVTLSEVEYTIVKNRKFSDYKFILFCTIAGGDTIHNTLVIPTTIFEGAGSFQMLLEFIDGSNQLVYVVRCSDTQFKLCGINLTKHVSIAMFGLI